MEETLIVLAADHGGPEAPEFMAALGMDVSRIMPNKLDVEPLVAALKERFGIGKELITLYYHPYIYLNREVIYEKGLEQAEVERALAAELMKLDGIAAAVPSSDLLRGDLPDTPLIRQIRRNFHPKRSGDIYLVQEPYWFLYSDEDIALCAMHGSPWRYDTYVPIIFAGMDVPVQRISRSVHPVDIAATLSTYLGVKPPSGLAGTPLVEVLPSRKACMKGDERAAMNLLIRWLDRHGSQQPIAILERYVVQVNDQEFTRQTERLLNVLYRDAETQGWQGEGLYYSVHTAQGKIHPQQPVDKKDLIPEEPILLLNPEEQQANRIFKTFGNTR